MKINEIMIGNTVTTTVGIDKETFPMKIVGIFRDTVYLDFEGNEGDVWEEKIEDINPIEINDKWLDNLGFKSKNTSKSYCWENGEFQICNGFAFWMIKNGINTQKIKYIHELENFINLNTNEGNN